MDMAAGAGAARGTGLLVVDGAARGVASAPVVAGFGAADVAAVAGLVGAAVTVFAVEAAVPAALSAVDAGLGACFAPGAGCWMTRTVTGAAPGAVFVAAVLGFAFA